MAERGKALRPGKKLDAVAHMLMKILYQRTEFSAEVAGIKHVKVRELEHDKDDDMGVRTGRQQTGGAGCPCLIAQLGLEVAHKVEKARPGAPHSLNKTCLRPICG